MTNMEECEDCECDKLNIGTSYGNSLLFSNTRCVKRTSRFQETLGELGRKASPEIQGRGRNNYMWLRFVSDDGTEGGQVQLTVSQSINLLTSIRGMGLPRSSESEAHV